MTQNPFTQALGWIGSLTAILGAILLIVGAVIAGNEARALHIFDNEDPLAGVPQMIFGGSLLNLGILALLLLIVAKAATWKPEPVEQAAAVAAAPHTDADGL